MAKQESVPFLTPWLTARFPKISKPDTQGQFADGKFKTDAVPQSEEDMKDIEATLLEAAKKFFPDVAEEDLQLPVMNFFANKDDKKAGKVEARGIRLKSKYRPAVFDSKKKRLPDSVTVGGGSVIRIASFIFPWSKTEKVKIKEGNKTRTEEQTAYGVGMRLGDVQVRKLSEGNTQGTGAAFDEDEDGFTYEGDEEADKASQFGDATDL